MPVPSAGVIVDTCTVKGDIKEVFDFLADFSNSVRWDPGVIAAAKQKETDEIKVGAAFDLTTRFNGKDSDMVYTITKYDSPREVVLVGDGKIVRGVDTIKFSEVEGGLVKIDYTADLSLKGFRKPFIIFLNKSFDKLGRSAMAGIENYYKHGNKNGPGQDEPSTTDPV